MSPLLDITKFHALYRSIQKGVGVTGSSVKISLKQVPPHIVRILTHVTLEDVTNSFTKVRLGIDSRGLTYYLDEIQTVAADELIVSRSDIVLGEGDLFFCDLTGTTTSDELFLTAIGWDQDK
jgi:hypothetical protein